MLGARGEKPVRKEEPRRLFPRGGRGDHVLVVELPLEIKSTADLESSRIAYSVYKFEFRSTLRSYE